MLKGKNGSFSLSNKQTNQQKHKSPLRDYLPPTRPPPNPTPRNNQQSINQSINETKLNIGKRQTWLITDLPDNSYDSKKLACGCPFGPSNTTGLELSAGVFFLRGGGQGGGVGWGYFVVSLWLVSSCSQCTTLTSRKATMSKLFSEKSRIITWEPFIFPKLPRFHVHSNQASLEYNENS